MTQTALLRIRLFGEFSVHSEVLGDVTPKSIKSQGLLALLSSDKNAIRSRNWLCQHLWSDRPIDQAKASLRQSLSEIRRCFGSQSSILMADHRQVALVKDRIVIEARDGSDARQFLDGLDLRDPQFMMWLTAMRQDLPPPQRSRRLDEGHSMGRGPAVYFQAQGRPGGSLRVVEDLVIDQVIRSLREVGTPQILTTLPASPRMPILKVDLTAFDGPDQEVGIRANVENVQNHQFVWSDMALTHGLHGPMNLSVEQLGFGQRIANILETETRAINVTGHLTQNPDTLSALGVRAMLSMDPAQLSEAERLFTSAIDIEPRGVFYAWRAQLAVIQYVEQVDTDKAKLREIADENCNMALSIDPFNSHVLAASANARLVLEDNVIASGELANAKLYAGDHEAAYRASVNAERLSKATPFEFWTAFLRSLTAAVTHREDEALAFGEMSRSLSPNFRPPLRYLLALYANRSDVEKAQYFAKRLAQVEKDFDVERMALDPLYPVSMMRKSGLLDLEKLKKSGLL